MKVLKVFEVAFDICDPEKLYQPLASIILDEIKTKYEKRCFKSSYIIEIKEILHFSECEISTDHQQCIGLLNVMFIALVEIYVPGNIIPVCVLNTKRSTGDFIGSSDDAAIQIVQAENEKILPAFKVGDIFPIQVKDVTYGSGQEKMTVLGCLPEIKPEKTVIYKITPANYTAVLNKSQLKAIGDFSVKMIEINSWIASLAIPDKKKLDEYVSVTYPYKSNKTSAIPKVSQFNFTEVKELEKLNEMKEPFYICYPPEISRSKPIALILENKGIDAYASYTFEENPMVVITDWLTTHYNYMVLIKSFTENYPSPMTERYKALWGLIHLKKEN